jgi:hypothetical protein
MGLAVVNSVVKYINVFVMVCHFNPRLIFPRKIGAFPSGVIMRLSVIKSILK